MIFSDNFWGLDGRLPLLETIEHGKSGFSNSKTPQNDISRVYEKKKTSWGRLWGRICPLAASDLKMLHFGS